MNQKHAMCVLQVGWRPKGTKALRNLGFRVEVIATAAQMDEGLDEPECADRILFVESFLKIETLILRVSREMALGAAYHAVIGFDEYALLPTAFLAIRLGLDALDLPLIEVMRDKSLQKKRLSDLGIHCAAVLVLEDVLSSAPPPFPFILKPVAGAGTNLTFHIRDENEWQTALEIIRAARDVRSFVAEEVIEGREYHMDGYVVDGQIRFLTISRYIQNVIKIKDGAFCGSVALSPEVDSQVYAEVKKWLNGILNSLKHLNGVFHVEAFHTGSSWVFSEAAMRVGGGGIPLQHLAMFGFDLFKSYAEACLQQPIQPPPTMDTQGYTGWINLPSVAGRLESYPSVAEIQERNGDQPVEFSLLPGYVVGDRSNNSVIRIGVSCVRGSSIEEVEQRAVAIAEWFLSEVRVSRVGEEVVS